MAGFWNLVKLRHGVKQWQACGPRGRVARWTGRSYLALQQPSSSHYSTPVCIQTLISTNHQTSLPIVHSTKIISTNSGRSDSHLPGEVPFVSRNMLMMKMCVCWDFHLGTSQLLQNHHCSLQYWSNYLKFHHQWNSCTHLGYRSSERTLTLREAETILLTNQALQALWISHRP